VTAIRQEQRDAGTDHFPAPTHVRFKRAADPLIVPATVPAIPMKLEDND
jgi:hypothetical protein